MSNWMRNILNDKRKVSFMILLIAVVIATAVLILYKVVSSAILSINISSMEELAAHDMNATTNLLNERWDDMDATVNDLRKNNFDSIEDMLSFLSYGDDYVNCKLLALTGNDGKIYRSTGVIGLDADKALYDKVMEYNDKFAVRFDYTGAQLESRKEYILIGLSIDPFTVAGVSFDHIFALTSIKSIESEMMVDSFNGEGTGYIIDMDGYYVVNDNRSHNFTSRNNYFEDISDAKIAGYSSANALKGDIASGVDTVSVSLSEGGIKYIVILKKMEHSSWYYVSHVPISVFSTQTNKILGIFSLIMGVFAFVVFLWIGMFLRLQRKRTEASEKYRAELSEALALAQQANRSKTTFLNNMSHDIRTPMNAIIGFTALATTHVENPEKVRTYLGKINKSSEHLLSLINDVLDMSRIESGKVIISENEENLAEIFHSLRDIFQSDINAKQMNFFMDTVDVTDERIICDKLRLNQVLLNVTSNALKYTSPGGTISLRIIQKKVKKSGYATYEFRIKDNGIGMSEDFVKTIFEPFTREETATVRGIQGTGLGMAITRNIVEMMGGTIKVNSKPNQGTEVIITLEFKLADQNESELKTIAKLDGMRGLVVDDDMNTCQSVSDMLRNVGMRAEWCTFGKEAVVRTEEALRIGDSFAVYIIDWLMPDMNGIETARRIRRAVGDDAPIIILTAYDWKDIEDEAIEAGVTGFVSKPVFPSDLRRTLMELCGEQVEKSSQVEEALPRFDGKRVLLAEDNDLNCEIAVEILQGVGFDVEIAENGKICVDMLLCAESGYYNLILMDIQMPIMDGYTAAKKIRALEDKQKAGIPILAMTANTFVEDKKAAADAGMDGHVGKPIHIQTLMSELKRLVERNSAKNTK